MYFDILYFHSDIDRDVIETTLLAQTNIEFDHKGIHQKKRVYILESPKKADILNAKHFQNLINAQPDVLHQWGVNE